MKSHSQYLASLAHAQRQFDSKDISDQQSGLRQLFFEFIPRAESIGDNAPMEFIRNVERAVKCARLVNTLKESGDIAMIRGMMEYYGIGTVPNMRAAWSLFQTAAQHKRADAHYYTGRTNEKLNMPQQAIEHYKKAAAANHAAAYTRLDTLRQERQDIPAADKAYRRDLKKGAALGDALAQRLLGEYYQEKKNIDQQFHWLGKAAYQGESSAILNINESMCNLFNNFFMLSDDTPMVPSQIKSMIDSIAKMDYVEGPYVAGLWHKKQTEYHHLSCEGRIPLKTFSYAKAIAHYQVAAEKGSTDALRDMADIYGTGGYGITKDPEKSFQYYLMAAKKKDALACHELSMLYQNHEIVPRNLLLALRCHNKAIEYGHIYEPTDPETQLENLIHTERVLVTASICERASANELLRPHRGVIFANVMSFQQRHYINPNNRQQMDDLMATVTRVVTGIIQANRRGPIRAEDLNLQPLLADSKAVLQVSQTNYLTDGVHIAKTLTQPLGKTKETKITLPKEVVRNILMFHGIPRESTDYLLNHSSMLLEINPQQAQHLSSLSQKEKKEWTAYRIEFNNAAQRDKVITANSELLHGMEAEGAQITTSTKIRLATKKYTPHQKWRLTIRHPQMENGIIEKALSAINGQLDNIMRHEEFKQWTPNQITAAPATWGSPMFQTMAEYRTSVAEAKAQVLSFTADIKGAGLMKLFTSIIPFEEARNSRITLAWLQEHVADVSRPVIEASAVLSPHDKSYIYGQMAKYGLDRHEAFKQWTPNQITAAPATLGSPMFRTMAEYRASVEQAKAQVLSFTADKKGAGLMTLFTRILPFEEAKNSRITLDWLQEHAADVSRPAIEASAVLSSHDKSYIYGQMAKHGLGRPENLEEAAGYFAEAASHYHASSQYEMGLIAKMAEPNPVMELEAASAAVVRLFNREKWFVASAIPRRFMSSAMQEYMPALSASASAPVTPPVDRLPDSLHWFMASAMQDYTPALSAVAEELSSRRKGDNLVHHLKYLKYAADNYHPRSLVSIARYYCSSPADHNIQTIGYSSSLANFIKAAHYSQIAMDLEIHDAGGWANYAAHHLAANRQTVKNTLLGALGNAESDSLVGQSIDTFQQQHYISPRKLNFRENVSNLVHTFLVSTIHPLDFNDTSRAGIERRQEVFSRIVQFQSIDHSLLSIVPPLPDKAKTFDLASTRYVRTIASYSKPRGQELRLSFVSDEERDHFLAINSDFFDELQKLFFIFPERTELHPSKSMLTIHYPRNAPKIIHDMVEQMKKAVRPSLQMVR